MSRLQEIRRMVDDARTTIQPERFWNDFARLVVIAEAVKSTLHECGDMDARGMSSYFPGKDAMAKALAALESTD